MGQQTEGATLNPLAFLDSLHVTDADGAITNRKWPEAQDAHAAVAELAAKANKVAVWLGRSALIADTNAQDTRFPSLAEAFSADAKNYRAIEAELRAALSPFSEAGR